MPHKNEDMVKNILQLDTWKVVYSFLSIKKSLHLNTSHLKWIKVNQYNTFLHI